MISVIPLLIYEISAQLLKVSYIFPSHQVTRYSNSIHTHVNCLTFLSDDVNPNEHHHF